MNPTQMLKQTGQNQWTKSTIINMAGGHFFIKIVPLDKQNKILLADDRQQQAETMPPSIQNPVLKHSR